MGYTTDGDLSSVTRPNGVTTAYGYDAAGRLHLDPSGHIEDEEELAAAQDVGAELDDTQEGDANAQLKIAYGQVARILARLVVKRLEECVQSAAEETATDAAERFAGTSVGTAAGGGSTSASLGAGASAAADPNALVQDA